MDQVRPQPEFNLVLLDTSKCFMANKVHSAELRHIYVTGFYSTELIVYSDDGRTFVNKSDGQEIASLRRKIEGPVYGHWDWKSGLQVFAYGKNVWGTATRWKFADEPPVAFVNQDDVV